MTHGSILHQALLATRKVTGHAAAADGDDAAGDWEPRFKKAFRKQLVGHNCLGTEEIVE
jgi:hypothetical protein